MSKMGNCVDFSSGAVFFQKKMLPGRSSTLICRESIYCLITLCTQSNSPRSSNFTK
ncbi:hypothetical protein Halhy_5022 [Haliscomenobacter hydrossis DSM 1100]|uniref:Uncharacterized protein n=1 Tax=Haliscomenobacter hydrossis (strain ATCC 27775 / DSM 1100 / LMG 10767 / O) TaxID=760192 RepID=F4L297_HALH1|nr:hypothetical protein Halhy_5022 [Haliscomenobacter hydrossis DSM 1100]